MEIEARKVAEALRNGWAEGRSRDSVFPSEPPAIPASSVAAAQPYTEVDRLIAGLKSHRALAVVIVVAIVLVAISTLTNSVRAISDFFGWALGAPSAR
jgi:hypothetical protein